MFGRLPFLHYNLIKPMPWEHQLTRTLGMTLDQTRFALSFFAACGLCLVLRGIKHPLIRSLFSGLAGFMLVYYPFGNNVLHALPTSLATYGAMILFPNKCGTWAWLINFPYLLVLHISNASGLAWNEGSMDFTGGQMVLTLKLIATAMTFQDHNSKKEQEMNAYQREHALRAVPPLHEFFGYVWCCGNLLGGPFIEYRPYQDFIRLQGLWDPARKPPRWVAIKHGFTLMAEAVVCVGLYLWLSRGWGMTVYETDWYKAQPLWARLGTMTISGTAYRCRYYFVWVLAEAQLSLAGLDFMGWGAKGQPEWGRARNVQPLHVETCSSGRELPKYWNTATGMFLRRYVYERLTSPGKKPGFSQLVITQLVSGVWHGLYAGYFMFFIGSAFLFASSTPIYKWEQGWPSLKGSTAWWLVKVAITRLCLDFLASAFLLLEWRTSAAAWASVYCLPLFYMGGMVAAGSLVPTAGGAHSRHAGHHARASSSRQRADGDAAAPAPEADGKEVKTE